MLLTAPSTDANISLVISSALNDQTDLTHRNFHCLLAAQFAEGKSRVRVLLEVAIQLLYLAQRVCTQIVVNLHFSLDDGELHNIIS